MQKLGLIFALILACGCAGSRKQGTSFADPYEGATISQMVGNNVSSSVFARTIVCLNARRETRLVTTLTNQTVSLLTNVTLNYITNQTLTVTTNLLTTFATNEIPVLAAGVATNAPEAEMQATGIPPQPGGSTNISVSTASNITLSKAGSQTVTTASAQTQHSRQVTTTANNVSITTADNQNISAETNLAVTVITNITINSITNVAILATNLPVHDYFVWAEFTPPPDFMLQSGEALVLLVDGVRHGLTPTNSPSVIVPRRGFQSVLCRVPPQLLVNIANARQVKIRLKGNGAAIEKEMSTSSRSNFKKFLVKHFKPEESATPEKSETGHAESPSASNS